MFCKHCGTENASATRFCQRCGTPLGADATAPGAAGNLGAVSGYAGPAETDGKAVASLVCGILFFFFPAAVAAVILGHLSLSEIRKSAGRLAGEGMAIAGLVLGYFGLAFIPIILIIAAIAIPNLLRARMAANEASAASSLRTIFTANATYSSTYDNGFAADLSELDGTESGAADCNHAQLLNEELASGFRNGYRFTYTPKETTGAAAKVSAEAAAKGCTVPGASGFSITAEAINRGVTGQRSFFIDESGVIRVEAMGAATENSPPLQ